MKPLDVSTLRLEPVEVLLREPDGGIFSSIEEAHGRFRSPGAIVADAVAIFAEAARRRPDGPGVNLSPVGWRRPGTLAYHVEYVTGDGAAESFAVEGVNPGEAAACVAAGMAAAALDAPRHAFSSRPALVEFEAALRDVVERGVFFARRSDPEFEWFAAAARSLRAAVPRPTPADARFVEALERHSAPPSARDDIHAARSAAARPVQVEFAPIHEETDDYGDPLGYDARAVVEAPASGEDLAAWLEAAAAQAGIDEPGAWRVRSIKLDGPVRRFAGVLRAVDRDGRIVRLEATLDATDEEGFRLAFAAYAVWRMDDAQGEGRLDKLSGREAFAAVSAVHRDLRIDVRPGHGHGDMANLRSLADGSRDRDGSVRSPVVAAAAALLSRQLAWNDAVNGMGSHGMRGTFETPVLSVCGPGRGPTRLDFDASRALFGVAPDLRDEEASAPSP